MSAADELAKLHELHEKGILTAEEYSIGKNKVLTGNAGNAGSTGGFFAGIAAKRLVNFIIGFTIFLVVTYIILYFFVGIPAEKEAEEKFNAFQQKNEKEFKEFGEKADKDMEDFRKKHGIK